MEHNEITLILEENNEIMTLLTIIDGLALNDCWLCAGTIRNFIWNYLLGNKTIDFLTDVDVIFYDPKISYEATQVIEQELKQTYPNYPWELKNQVYMHQHNPHTLPYKNSKDAITKFPETCTAIAVRLNQQQHIELFTPYGIKDLLCFNICPTPYYLQDAERMRFYNQRVSKKNWQQKWPNVTLTLI